ncbi:MAG TPA: tol-pal system protein YbgF [Polyangia bacterium]|nr:tol-pal system protein YbgF [Polyangia bacterium]
MRVVRSCAFVLLVLPGCAGSQTVTRAEVTELRQRLDDQARRAANAEHKIDELENRVFLLTDQLESAKVASLHRATKVLPPLPVVTLKPDGATPAAREDGALATGEDIEFAGAARSNEPDVVRPVLRLDGDARPSATTTAARRSSSLHEVDLTAQSDSDNLGVAAVPPIHGSAPSVASRSTATERSAPAGEPLALYRSAYDDLRAGHHDEAARQFRDFVKRYPRHDYADNAQYWLGEVYYDQKRFDEAAPEFRAVVQRWPTGNKAPDAMLKLGFTLAAEGKTTEARTILRELPSAYPHTEAARLAEERLTQLSPTEGTK